MIPTPNPNPHDFQTDVDSRMICVTRPQMPFQYLTRKCLHVVDENRDFQISLIS